jgi:hypothetical protein
MCTTELVLLGRTIAEKWRLGAVHATAVYHDNALLGCYAQHAVLGRYTQQGGFGCIRPEEGQKSHEVLTHCCAKGHGTTIAHNPVSYLLLFPDARYILYARQPLMQSWTNSATRSEAVCADMSQNPHAATEKQKLLTAIDAGYCKPVYPSTW